MIQFSYTQVKNKYKKKIENFVRKPALLCSRKARAKAWDKLEPFFRSKHLALGLDLRASSTRSHH